MKHLRRFVYVMQSYLLKWSVSVLLAMPMLDFNQTDDDCML